MARCSAAQSFHPPSTPRPTLGPHVPPYPALFRAYCPQGGTVTVNPEDGALVNDLLRQQWCSAFCMGTGGDAALAS